MNRVVALCLLSVIFVASSVAAETSSQANPDTQHIIVLAQGQKIQVLARNDADDYRNLQWSFDKVLPGGKIELQAGTFFLGDNDRSPRKTVLMRHGFTLKGKRQDGNWLTIIQGGGAIMEPGVGGAIESGPIRININDGSHPAIFDQLWFRDWACEVVFNEAGPGLVFRNSRISEPANRSNSGIKYVHALWSSGVKTRGDFIVENNLVELSGYNSQPADDEQLLGVFFSNHDNIRVVNNTITGMDEAIEIIGNRNPRDGEGVDGPATIVVDNNRMDITANPGRNWPSSYAILIGGNRNTDSLSIRGNSVVTRGRGWGLGLSGNDVSVIDNYFHFEKYDGEYPPGGITLGFGGGRFDMGASLTDSVFKNNTFEGKLNGPGLVFQGGSEATPNRSRNNIFELGDAMVKLGAQPTLVISESVQGNTFIGQQGEVNNQSPDGANQFEGSE